MKSAPRWRAGLVKLGSSVLGKLRCVSWESGFCRLFASEVSQEKPAAFQLRQGVRGVEDESRRSTTLLCCGAQASISYPNRSMVVSEVQWADQPIYARDEAIARSLFPEK